MKKINYPIRKEITFHWPKHTSKTYRSMFSGRRRKMAGSPMEQDDAASPTTSTTHTPPSTTKSPLQLLTPLNQSSPRRVPVNQHQQQQPSNQQPANQQSLHKKEEDMSRMSNGTIILNGRVRLDKTIGSGSYGKVKLATDLSNGRKMAVKFIPLSSIKKSAHVLRIRREINLTTLLDHQNIIKLYEYIETDTDIILLMEYIEGNDLFNQIVGMPSHSFTEAEARPLFQQLVASLEYCHRHRVIHRDIKPENVMVNKDGKVKLIDFGFATMYHANKVLETNCGSPLYAAPEIVKGIHYRGPEVDCWSLGVVFYAMLTGNLPFEDKKLKGLYQKICLGSFEMPKTLSPSAKDLIRRMLTVDNGKRASMLQIQKHPWLTGGLSLPKSLPIFSRMKNAYNDFDDISSTAAQTHTFLVHAPHHTVRGEPDKDIIREMIAYGYPDPAEAGILVRADGNDPALSIYLLLLHKRQHDSSYQKKAVQPLARYGILSKTSPLPLLTAQPAQLLQLHQSKRTISELASSPQRRFSNIQMPPTPYIRGDHPMSTPPTPKTPSNIVSQAAASVASHFKKLRGLTIGSSGSHTKNANDAWSSLPTPQPATPQYSRVTGSLVADLYQYQYHNNSQRSPTPAAIGKANRDATFIDEMGFEYV